MTLKPSIMPGRVPFPKLSVLYAVGLLAMLVIGTVPGLAAGPDAPSSEATGERVLPPQPTAVVLSMTILPPDGGADVSAPPWMEVFADGRVIVRGEHPGDPTTRGHLTRAQLQSLVSEVVGEQQLLSCDTLLLQEQLQLAGARRGISANVEGASTTVLQIVTRDRTHEITCQAVPLLERRFPEVDAMQRLAHCRRRMLNLAAIVRAGGETAAVQLCDAVNRQLASDWPDIDPVTPEDLQVVRFGPGGSRMCQFLVPGQIGVAGETGMVSVAAIRSPGSPLRVSVLPGSVPGE
ncbi:hypothetical protein Mal4_26440 [Maioricimonas rarisocia]|uniref:Uncharacterized protein n=1 Tax=Maioricimonas rarisocia TaxID=2528026 RepID=A0A517Z756_9PLAN|nr:hypothetical protein [Maioricimonas rarisocia]QDU38317.1 hypothetical protein Mal4_26440 [Maioricimonas rarisocia]